VTPINDLNKIVVEEESSGRVVKIFRVSSAKHSNKAAQFENLNRAMDYVDKLNEAYRKRTQLEEINAN